MKIKAQETKAKRSNEPLRANQKNQKRKSRFAENHVKLILGFKLLAERFLGEKFADGRRIETHGFLLSIGL